LLIFQDSLCCMLRNTFGRYKVKICSSYLVMYQALYIVIVSCMYTLPGVGNPKGNHLHNTWYENLETYVCEDDLHYAL